jgi:hypothetical protein
VGLEGAAQDVIGDLPDKVGFLLEVVGGYEVIPRFSNDAGILVLNM